MLARTSAWGGMGVERGMPYARFRSRIPLQTHADLAPHVERMKRGEADILWPGACQVYALTSGTTGAPKHIPMTEPMLGHIKRCGMNSAFWYMARARGAGLLRGRHLYVGGSTALSPIAESEPFEAYAGEVSAIAALNMPGWVERHLFEPGHEIAQMAAWQERVEAIAERTPRADITMISGFPSWVLVLAEAIRARAPGGGRDEAPGTLWPNLDCLMHGGIPAGPYMDELRTALGPDVAFHETYRAAEGFIAAQDAEAAAGLRLMADAGVFFEFLPMSQFSESRLGELGEAAVPLSGVAAGVDYALVLTAPSGLARYVLGDVVRFVTTNPARLVYVGRTGLRLNAFGEQVAEKDITEALLAVCRRNGWTIVNFHVAPLHLGGAGRHEWWVELKAGTTITPTGPIIAAELDTELRKLSRDYESRRRAGKMEAPFVRLVMPGVFEHWMRFHGKWGGQNKMPRCCGDRFIANELGEALQFAKD